MSYAIIRNENYKIKNLSGIYRHNERKNTNYSNEEIEKEKSKYNYSIKKPLTTYEKTFNEIKKKYNLKGQIKKVSNIMCEFIITSDKEFFENIGEEETKRYFKTAYDFVSKYKNLGEKYIVSAKVHMDETTPHMHLLFIPVVHTKDKQGNKIDKIACSEYWKGKDSYRKLQDEFYSYITKAGFKLERGETKENKHIPIETLKNITEYENIKYEIQNNEIKAIETQNTALIVAQNKQLIQYTNKLKSYFVKSVKAIEKCSQLEEQNRELKEENSELRNKNKRLIKYINNIFEVIKNIFKIPREEIIKEIKVKMEDKYLKCK